MTSITSPAEEEDDASSAAQPSSLSMFHKDIILEILSYVADVPFEIVENISAVLASHSTLTHTLPLVSKQFHRLAGNHDQFWKNALLRLVLKEPSLWEEGLKRVTFEAKCDAVRLLLLERTRSRATGRRDKRAKNVPLDQQQPPPQSTSQQSTPALTREEDLLQRACTALLSHPPLHHTATSTGTYQCVFQTITLGHLRYQAPVFWMPSSLKLGRPYGLHFFEPRYRVLVAEVMAPHPLSARRGSPVSPLVPGIFPPPLLHGQLAMDDDVKVATLDLLENYQSLLGNYYLPTFIHAHQALNENTPAAIVQVLRCDIQPDGSADVFLKPLAYIWLDKIWERPGTGGLVEARGLRMGKEASEGYQRWCDMRRYGRGDGPGREQMLPIP